MIEEQYQRALEVLSKNKESYEKLAERLLEKEVIFSEDLENIFGKRMWGKPEMVENQKNESIAELQEKPEGTNESKQQ